MTACADKIISHDPACGRDVDQELQHLAALLPRGRAWPRRLGSTMMNYWKSVADVMVYFNERLCALVEEFYCDTTTELLDVWLEQYDIETIEAPIGLPVECIKPDWDPNANMREKLCAAVIAQGGNTVDYLQSILIAENWIATVTDISAYNPPVSAGSVCLGNDSRIGVRAESFTLPAGVPASPHADSTGNFPCVVGSGYHFLVEIDWLATREAFDADAAAMDGLWMITGLAQAGDQCLGLRNTHEDILRELIDRYKPAHTTYILKYNYP